MSSDNNPWTEVNNSSTTPNGSPQKSILSTSSSSITPLSKKRNSFNKTSTSDSTTSDLRPLRLPKQSQLTRINSTTNSESTTTPTTSTFDRRSSAPSIHQKSVEDFQCRPIRLGSRTNTTIMSPSEVEKRKSITSSNTSSPSQRNSFSSTSSNKRKSIQIKNLPILLPTETKNIDKNVDDDMIFAICLVDFHHQRGPEIQWWKSNYHPEYSPDLFKNISFQALPDGSHLFEETYSNFNLVYDFDQKKSIDNLVDMNDFKGDPRHLKTLFGCSCVRQVKTSLLSEEEKQNKNITRSIVQKAIVVICRSQPIFTKIKEKLSIITQSYFQQETFGNFEVLEHLFENLNQQFKLVNSQLITEEEENYVNLNLVNSILKFRTNFMIIFKSLLLEKKIMIYSNNNLEMLTQFQNNLISLIPNLINNLDDSGCPLIDYMETNGPLTKPQSLNTTDRLSMLRFFGLPLQIFNTKNSFWNPYLPLQQLDELKVDSFMIGCSNLLFVNQASGKGIDLVINLDSNEITYPKSGQYVPDELILSNLDKRFINFLIGVIESTVPKDDFVGSDDYIRYKFEDYLNSLISSTRYIQYKERFNQLPPGFNIEPTIQDFRIEFINNWKQTQNFKIWNLMSDEFIFNFIDPKHVATNYEVNNNSINKNISNWFNNNFKFNKSSSQQQPDGKAHKFIDDDEEDAEDDTIDELVAGFEKVGGGNTPHDSSSIASPTTSNTMSSPITNNSNMTTTSQSPSNKKWNWGFK
ncbi:unnamed protein product [Candida verbasci]|uniref:UDENN domain-containing protein n=1 Tax=Candida verbasci TaxID=1227364 RepID=A0A9W4TZK5_9ASCO|nr:unnamed protein product [Candida verbasci]